MLKVAGSWLSFSKWKGETPGPGPGASPEILLDPYLPLARSSRLFLFSAFFPAFFSSFFSVLRPQSLHEFVRLLFRGIPDVLEEGQELWGVYVFKRGFGGYPMMFLETHDLVYSPLVYGAYMRLLEVKRRRDERMRRKIEEKRKEEVEAKQ